jgi:predicted DNA-binding protein
MKILPISLKVEQYEFLEKESKQQGNSKASILRKLLTQYMLEIERSSN